MDKKKGILERKSTKTIVMAIMAIIIVASFIVLFQRGKNSGTDEKKTELSTLLVYDMENNYPKTARGVLKLYNRYTMCLYNSKLSESDIATLLKQVRLLFDEELLESNSWDEHFETIKAEIKEYKAKKKAIVSYQIQKESEKETANVDGKNYTTLLSSYFVTERKKQSKNYQQYILRQDKDKRWKILGWQLTEPTEFLNENDD